MAIDKLNKNKFLNWLNRWTIIDKINENIDSINTINAPTIGTVTQATSSTTGVTLNYKLGAITTVALTTAADTTFQFTLTNSYITSSSIIQIGTVIYTGAGVPLVRVSNISTGAATISVSNVHPSAAFSAAMLIGFEIKG